MARLPTEQTIFAAAPVAKGRSKPFHILVDVYDILERDDRLGIECVSSVICYQINKLLETIPAEQLTIHMIAPAEHYRLIEGKVYFSLPDADDSYRNIRPEAFHNALSKQFPGTHRSIDLVLYEHHPLNLTMQRRKYDVRPSNTLVMSSQPGLMQQCADQGFYTACIADNLFQGHAKTANGLLHQTFDYMDDLHSDTGQKAILFLDPHTIIANTGDPDPRKLSLTFNARRLLAQCRDQFTHQNMELVIYTTAASPLPTSQLSNLTHLLQDSGYSRCRISIDANIKSLTAFAEKYYSSAFPAGVVQIVASSEQTLHHALYEAVGFRNPAHPYCYRNCVYASLPPPHYSDIPGQRGDRLTPDDLAAQIGGRRRIRSCLRPTSLFGSSESLWSKSSTGSRVSFSSDTPDFDEPAPDDDWSEQKRLSVLMVDYRKHDDFDIPLDLQAAYRAMTTNSTSWHTPCTHAQLNKWCDDFNQQLRDHQHHTVTKPAY